MNEEDSTEESVKKFRQQVKNKISVMIVQKRWDENIPSEEIAEDITQYIWEDLV